MDFICYKQLVNMEKLRLGLLFLVLTACGTRKEQVSIPDIKIKDAYYITEVGGTAYSSMEYRYFFELSEMNSACSFDSVWINDVRLELAQMGRRPILISVLKNPHLDGTVHLAKIRASYKGEYFYLQADSVYEKERRFRESIKRVN